MTKCSFCGNQISSTLPYVCNFCDEKLCADHRLPENHECINIDAVKGRYFDKNKFRFKRPENTPVKHKSSKKVHKKSTSKTGSRSQRPRGRSWKTPLLIIIILVGAIGYAYTGGYFDSTLGSPDISDPGTLPSPTKTPIHFDTVDLGVVAENPEEFLDDSIAIEGTLEKRPFDPDTPYQHILVDDTGTSVTLKPHSSSLLELKGGSVTVRGSMSKQPLRSGGYEYVFETTELLRPTPTPFPTPTPTQIPETETPQSTDTPVSTHTQTESVQAPRSVGDFDDNRIEEMIHEEVNRARQEQGLHTLQWSPMIHSNSDKWSKEMANSDYLYHGGLDTLECGTVKGENIAKAYVYKSRYSSGGIAEWYTEEELAKTIVDGWMNSEGHRENILRPSFRREGIGIFITEDGTVWATQEFCG